MSDTASPLKQRLKSELIVAMKAGEKDRRDVIRLIMSAIKQREVDERIELDDEQIILVLDKMLKQRRESISQYSDAGRNDLAEQEAAEISVIETYMPEKLSDADIETLIAKAIGDTGAASMRDMGKVMAILKPAMQGRADMAAVSSLIKQKLG